MRHVVRGAGPPILFLHGIPTSRRLWDLVIGRLEDRFTCVAVDLPGLGESPRPAGPPHPDPTARALEALRAGLGVERWHLAGHDAGATLAVHYAAAFPARVDRLALLAPPVYPELVPPLPARLMRTPVLGDLLAPAIVWLIFHGGLRAAIECDDPAIPGILDAFHRPFRGLAGSRRMTWLVRWGEPADVLGRTAALLPGIAAPTLVLHGRRDAAVPESFAHRAGRDLPDARVTILDGSHFLPLNLPEEVAGELGRFFAARHGGR